MKTYISFKKKRVWAMPIALFLENWLKVEDGTSLKEREKLIITPPLIARNLSVRTLHEQLVIINYPQINQSLTMIGEAHNNKGSKYNFGEINHYECLYPSHKPH